MRSIVRKTILLSVVSAMLFLCSCGIYDKEYVAENDYVIPSVSSVSDSDKISVSNFYELKKAVGSLVKEGRKTGTIIFSEGYEGDASEDLAEACWQERSQDALCAYCVDNISYELSRIVSYYEANITVTYADTGVAFEDIYQISYTTGLSDLIEQSLNNTDRKLVVLVNSSSYTSDSITSLVQDIYYTNPIVAPKEPTATVQIYSGTGLQKLYSVSFNYGISDEERLRSEIDEMKSFNPISEKISTDDYEKIVAICRYLTENCTIGEDDSIYEAMINGSGSSKAIAFETTALCNKLGLRSFMVTGQKFYNDHYWNIVKINGFFYHFDASAVIEGYTNTFLMSDDEMWSSYRWDTSSYPKCEMSYLID